MKINKFENKSGLFKYLIKKFIKKQGAILLRGSMINQKVRNYSDFDLEIYINKPRKPYYEIIFINKKICLISIWFGKYKKGKIVKIPKNIKVISGEYLSYMNYIRDNGKYSGIDRVRRENQAVIDWLFKYLRNKKPENLIHIQKRIT